MTAGLHESGVMVIAAVCKEFYTSSSSSQFVVSRPTPLTYQVSWSSWIVDFFFLSLQEKGIPLMGESSFLASWFNRCAVIMGMFIYVCLLLYSSGSRSVFPQPCNSWNVFPASSSTPLSYLVLIKFKKLLLLCKKKRKKRRRSK